MAEQEDLAVGLEAVAAREEVALTVVTLEDSVEKAVDMMAVGPGEGRGDGEIPAARGVAA